MLNCLIIYLQIFSNPERMQNPKYLVSTYLELEIFNLWHCYLVISALIYLFFYPFVYTYLFTCVCFCLWVSVVCHCTRGAQSTPFQSLSLLPLCVGQRLNSVSAVAARVLIRGATLLTHVSLLKETIGSSKEGLLSSCLS